MSQRVACPKYMHDSSDPLVAPLLLLVQQLFLRLIQEHFRPYVVDGAAAFHTVVLYHVLHIVFLADGDGPFLTIAGDVHPEDLQTSLHDESTLVGTFRLDFLYPPYAHTFISRGDCSNRYQFEDAVLLQTRNRLVQCYLPKRGLGQAHGLFEGVRDAVRFSPSRTARLRVGPGVGDFSSNPVGIKLMCSIRRVCVGVKT